MSTSNTLIKCMEGIGDQIYVRPFIKAYAEIHSSESVFVDTTLPFLFSDLPVQFVKRQNAQYRTQKAALAKNDVKMVDLPKKIDKTIYQHYSNDDLKNFNIIGNLTKRFGVLEEQLVQLSLPDALSIPNSMTFRSLKLAGRKIAVVRPVTYRVEFHCTTKAPLPGYVAWCAKLLREAGYFVISIADCVEGEEWIVGDEPPADLKLHAGELGLAQTLGLIREADLVIGGPGFIVPAAIAAGTDLFIIFGGRGGFDNPYHLLDLRLNTKSKLGWAIPNNFCRCKFWTHDCDKTINDLDSQFFRYMMSRR